MLKHTPTDAYLVFVETWADHCGAPRSVFIGQLGVMLEAECQTALKQAGEDTVQAVREMSEQNRRYWTALDDLLVQALTHLQSEHPEPATRAELIARMQKARGVLGLVTP